MYNSGDAAEQVVRMSLEGAEFALKITGSAAKNLAAALYTVLKDQKKTKGKAHIEAIFIDEFHVMFENEYSAAFFDSAWRQFRKRNASHGDYAECGVSAGLCSGEHHAFQQRICYHDEPGGRRSRKASAAS